MDKFSYPGIAHMCIIAEATAEKSAHNFPLGPFSAAVVSDLYFPSNLTGPRAFLVYINLLNVPLYVRDS
jgi:hypothetical protein